MQQQSKWVFDVWLRRAYIKKMNGEFDNLKEKKFVKQNLAI